MGLAARAVEGWRRKEAQAAPEEDTHRGSHLLQRFTANAGQPGL